MTRKLTLAMVGLVAATLICSGLVTLVLARLDARRATARELEAQAQLVAELQAGRPRLNALGVATSLGAHTVIVSADGRLRATVRARPLPPRLAEVRLDPARLQAGEMLSGAAGRFTWAAVATGDPTAAGLPAVLLTRTTTPALGDARRWFALSGAATLAAGAAVALLLGRRLAAPLAQAGDVAQRIAAGDLAARADEAQAAAGGAEIESLTRSLNAMADSLERSRGLEQQFLLSISHDLRTPLTSIRGYAEAILDGALDEPQHGARVIRSEAARLERLVADLLELARLEARQFGLSPAPLDLARLAADGAAGFAPAAEAAGRRITVRAEPTWVLADRDRLAQVIANLVENALRFAASQVEVRAGPGPDGMGWLQVADDGPGIAAEDLPHVFERLYVARSRPRRKESGSGLGLAIVRELVAAMGGVVHAEAPPGGGASLVVRLPPAPTPPTPGGSGG